ncbi:polyprenyl synthetase family protein [Lacticaseibacillus mingshuiensis]|uniref:Polyprenyl synthetase family protein n=1 Tax=Lacticaseibacillus mingshuiensis TaxID=2799574 RepID=A0ABW4CIW0_9LACO|nr:farnesyl diphosphate synthase [Lacticaseibacillus mingshuiensis]
MLDDKVVALLPAVEQTLQAHLDQVANVHLRKAMAYSLTAGGKRLRPLLLLAVVQSFAGPVEAALPAAAGIECLHTYSLIHDDLPAMDNDDLRRGQPTSHKVFGSALAILAGDALQTAAFELVSATPAAPEVVVKLVRTLAKASGASGMVAGQVMDMDGETVHYDLPTLQQLHALKTGALLAAAVQMGAQLAAVSAADQAALATFGEQFGVAFQIQDDINDVTETSAQLGKTAGKDLSEHKNTYPALLGLTGAKDALQAHVAAAEAALHRLSRPAPQLDSFLTYFE